MFNLFLRTLVMYVTLIAGVRLLGKRQIGQLEPSELVVAMLVADLAAIPLQEEAVSLLSGLIPMATVLLLEFGVSMLCLRSVRLRRLLCGKPVILISNGEVLQENLRRTRITMDELTGMLREKDMLELEEVQYAILETNGNLSVFPFPASQPPSARASGIRVKRQFLPVTVIADGWLYRENLALAGKDEAWLNEVLQQKNATVRETWLLTVDAGDHIFFVAREGK